jgi:hypothetical protein
MTWEDVLLALMGAALAAGVVALVWFVAALITVAV